LSRTNLYPCSNCGYQVKPGENFCQSCGIKLSSSRGEEQVKNNVYYQEEPVKASIPRGESINSYKGYVQVIGAFTLVFGLLPLIGGLLITLVSFAAPFLVRRFAPEYSDIAIFGAVLIFAVGLLVLLIGTVYITSAVKLMQFKNSGRIGTLIIAVISLFEFPFGTLFGAAALYVLTRPEAEQLFNESQEKPTRPGYYYSVSS